MYISVKNDDKNTHRPRYGGSKPSVCEVARYPRQQVDRFLMSVQRSSVHFCAPLRGRTTARCAGVFGRGRPTPGTAGVAPVAIDVFLTQGLVGGLVGDNPNFGRSALGCIEADFCNQGSFCSKIYKTDTLLHRSKVNVCSFASFRKNDVFIIFPEIC